MRLLAAVLFLHLCVRAACADAGVVTGYIGSHKLTFSAQAISDEAVFAVDGCPDYLAITEVYPDTPDKVEYRYDVSSPGIGCYERSHVSTGFGPITYFIKVSGHPIGRVTIGGASKSQTRPVRIASVRGVDGAELKRLLESDDFRLMGWVPTVFPVLPPDERDGTKQAGWVDTLLKNLRCLPQYHISTGMAYEIWYSRLGEADVKKEIAACRKWARRYNVPILLGLVSWWGGTPVGVPDGLGGTFTDIKYQQVCYSPDVEVPDNPDLKALLGNRYDTHYGLSIPNQWGTPWLTMNSDVLNQYRYRRLDEAVEQIKDISCRDSSWICGIFLDNEPRYWDTQAEAGNPRAGRQGKTLWADFNPLVIEAALKDGLDLNPANGLSNEEFSWLHRNVGKYCQDTVDSLVKSLSARRFGSTLPLYTHSIQYPDCTYPGGPIKHPTVEWAYADGARTGIEGMWTWPSDFDRVREWGRWSNLNREESVQHDGIDASLWDLHLWDLRVAYMRGADLYNSYNWQLCGAENFFRYVNEFLTEFPTVNLPPEGSILAGPNAMTIQLPMKLQAFTRVEMPVEVKNAVKGTARMVVTNGDKRRYSSLPETIDLAPGVHSIGFDFPVPPECTTRSWNVTLTLGTYDGKGKPADDSIRFTADSTAKLRLLLDMRTQRALSLWVIDRAKR